MDLGLAGKRVMVTGSTRGIGRSIVEHLIAEGAQVAICARDAEAVEAAVAELSGGGAKVIGRAVDVSNSAELTRWVNDAAQQLGGLDIFVPNVSAGGGPTDKWQVVFDIDILGTVRGIEAALPHLKAAGGGSIVIINTTAAVETFRGPSAYAAMKAGLLNYAKNLSLGLGVDNVRVNSVLPGPVYFEGGAWEGLKATQPEMVAALIETIPLGRMADPADVAKAVTFLVSEAAQYISGTSLVVDGGMLHRVQY